MLKLSTFYHEAVFDSISPINSENNGCPKKLMPPCKLISGKNLQNFEFLSHRGLWIKMLETWVF